MITVKLLHDDMFEKGKVDICGIFKDVFIVISAILSYIKKKKPFEENRGNPLF